MGGVRVWDGVAESEGWGGGGWIHFLLEDKCVCLCGCVVVRGWDVQACYLFLQLLLQQQQRRKD